MQIVAGSWLIYRMTDSAFLLGVFAFALNFPAMIFSPFAGVAADRFDRRSLLVLINTLAVVQAFVLWVLVLTGMVQVWHVMVLSTLQGILNAYELPVRQSLISQLIDDPKDLPNAIALNSSVYNGSRLIGPAVAGVAIAMWGEGFCFLVNAISFLPVIASLCLMRLPKKMITKKTRKGGARAGFSYVYHSMPIRTLLIMVSVLSMMSGAFYSLAPVFAKDVFKGGPQTLGLLLSCSGCGAFLGAIYLASRKTVLGLSRVIAKAGLGAGVAYMCFSIMIDIRFAVVAAFLSGLFMIMSIGGMNVIIQTLVDEEMRGRVMSLYGIALVGISPVGSILAGVVASRAGAMPALFLAGVFTVACTGLFLFQLPRFRAHVRLIYAAKGIVPEVQ